MRLVYLDELDLSHMVQGWERPRARRSCYDTPLRIGGREYERGVGTHAEGAVWVRGAARGL